MLFLVGTWKRELAKFLSEDIIPIIYQEKYDWDSFNLLLLRTSLSKEKAIIVCSDYCPDRIKVDTSQSIYIKGHKDKHLENKTHIIYLHDSNFIKKSLIDVKEEVLKIDMVKQFLKEK